MLLKEIFDQLTFGELSQISVGGAEMGTINETNYLRIIPHINTALTEVYKRFPIKEGRGTFDLVPGSYIYSLADEDVIRIVQVLNNNGNELSLNNPSDYYSCYTTSPKVLKVSPDIVDNVINTPDFYKSTSLNVIYKANHAKIVDSIMFDPETVELELPDTYLMPVLYFIASRVLSPVGAGQFQGMAGNVYLQKYEAACQLIISQNPELENTSCDDKFINNGWA